VIRAVIDTNVLVSALISPKGNEALILLAIHQGIVRPCSSEEILDEYAEVLNRRKFAFQKDVIGALMAMLRERGELLTPTASTTASPIPAIENFSIARKPRRPNTS
jgi:uncharacterized protein